MNCLKIHTRIISYLVLVLVFFPSESTVKAGELRHDATEYWRALETSARIHKLSNNDNLVFSDSLKPTIRYSIEQGAFPFSYRHKESKRVVGYIHDLLALYSGRSNIHFEYVPPKGRSLHTMLMDGDIDFYPTTQKQASQFPSVIHTTPFLTKKWVKVLGRHKQSHNSRIGILARSHGLFTGEISGLDKDNYQIYVDLHSMQKALWRGDIRTAYLPKEVADYHLYYSNDDVFKIARGSEAKELTEQLVFVSKPALKSVIEALNREIKNTTSDERDMTMRKHQMIHVQYGFDKAIVVTVFVAICLLVLLVALFAHQRYVHLSLNSREKELRIQSSQEQLRLLNTIIERYPGMIAILNPQNEIVVANHQFEACYQGCIQNQCLVNPSRCSLLSVMLDLESDKTIPYINIEKDICPINTKYYQVHKEVITNNQHLVSYKILFLTDITKNQLQQKQIEESRIEAVNALKAREAFLAMISHELRTPLAAIIGVLDLLNSDVKPPSGRELLTSAQTSAKRLNLLVNDILDFSKIEAGQMQLDPVEGSIFDQLAPQLRVFEAIARNKNIDFAVRWHPTSLAYAVTDWSRLIQVVNNVVNNAVKFTDVGAVTVEITQSVDELAIVVKDSGSGMTAEQVEIIFQPFVQADRSISRRFGGSGLGMSIVNNLVQLMSGKIDIDSEPNMGTVVTIRFPVQFFALNINHAVTAYSNNAQVALWLKCFKVQCELNQKSEAIELHYVTANIYPDMILSMLLDNVCIEDTQTNPYIDYTGTVLVADDDPINRLLFEKQLFKLGINYVSVQDGEHAYRYLEQYPDEIDILITDCHMPIMDGYELTKTIRNNNQLAHLPIIGCTAEDSRLAAQRAESAGMNMMLYKPYTIEGLAQAIKNHARLTFGTQKVRCADC